jgi:hypothetical protein
MMAADVSDLREKVSNEARNHCSKWSISSREHRWRDDRCSPGVLPRNAASISYSSAMRRYASVASGKEHVTNWSWNLRRA